MSKKKCAVICKCAINRLFYPKYIINLTGGCPNGWITYEDFCYLFRNEMTSWDEASHICRNLGGNLVSIKDEQEQDFVLCEFISN